MSAKNKALQSKKLNVKHGSPMQFEVSHSTIHDKDGTHKTKRFRGPGASMAALRKAFATPGYQAHLTARARRHE